MNISTKLKVFVIDPNPRFHETYAYYFSTYPEYELTGIYPSIETALRDFDQEAPDFILSETMLPDLSGVDGICEFRKRNPDVKVIMVSEENDFQIIKKAFKNG